MRVDDAACENLVLGGGGQMWGETADPSDVLATVWPDLAAIAERLWSPRNATDPLLAEPRLESFRCHLEERDVPVTAINNAQSRTALPGPGFLPRSAAAAAASLDATVQCGVFLSPRKPRCAYTGPCVIPLK